MPRTATCLLLLLCTACSPAPTITPTTTIPGAGPRGADVSIELGEEVRGAFELNCAFQGGGGRAIVLYYRQVNKEWRPMLSCNNGAGPHAPIQRVPAEDADTTRIMTGWYTEGSAWKQCDMRGWKRDEHSEFLSCRTPDGWAITFTCATGRCPKP